MCGVMREGAHGSRTAGGSPHPTPLHHTTAHTHARTRLCRPVAQQQRRDVPPILQRGEVQQHVSTSEVRPRSSICLVRCLLASSLDIQRVGSESPITHPCHPGILFLPKSSVIDSHSPPPPTPIQHHRRGDHAAGHADALAELPPRHVGGGGRVRRLLGA